RLRRPEPRLRLPAGRGLPGGGVSRGDGRASAPPLRWRVRRDGPASGARNMALDHALAETIGAAAAAVRASSVAGAAGGVPAAGPHGPEAALRLYTWARPTVSFGRNEPAGGPEAWAGRADAFVRRPTGGRAVLHAAELTYAAVVPARALGGVRA